MSNRIFAVVTLSVALALAAVTQLIPNEYFFSAAYTVLLFVILATAWNILGGYTGYVNFGSAAFFAIGAYTTVFLYNAFRAPLPVGIVAGTLVAGVAGLGLGYLTLRLRGVFFAIASLALAVVLYIFIVNWDYVGGARGAYVLQPREVPFGLPRYIHLIYAVQLVMAAFALVVARAIEKSTRRRMLGRADAQAQDLLDHGELRADGHGGNHLSLLPFLHRAELGVQPVVRGQQHCDAAYRRHDELDRAADRRDPAGQRPAAGAGDVLSRGVEPAHRRRAAGALRHARPERHHGLGGRLAAGKGAMMAQALLEVRGVTKRFGGFTALDRVDFLVHPGERVGLIGPNGSGKSTLVNCIAGTLRNEEGSIRFEGEDIHGHAAYRRIRLGLARSFQIPKPFASMTVLDNLCVPLLYAGRRHEKLAPGRIVEEAMRILGQVGLAGRARAMSGGLTQVDMRKLELARAMAAKPKLLISDEAMAGLSASEVDGVAVIMIEHVMRAVMKFSERIAVLVAGRKIADGNPQSVVGNAEVVKAYLGE